jgi:ribosomal protein S8E
MCVCASPDTPIATPDGDRAIASLRVGDRVLSVDHGRIVDVPILEVHQRPAKNHHVVRVELTSGAVLEISAPHPTADGRTFGDLGTNDALGGVRIERVSVVPYTSAFTYDILPASDSGTYYAGGVLIGSTLGGAALSSGPRDYAAMTLPGGAR